MDFIQSVILIIVTFNLVLCHIITKPILTTTQSLRTNNTNQLVPSRLESIKNSYSELNLLSKLNVSDFIFDFGNAVTGVSLGTGGRTVSATVVKVFVNNLESIDDCFINFSRQISPV